MIKMRFELPLFPLNTVLFPGMPLPLHIFEDRYKEMVSYCLKEHRPFGVVLIREGVAEQGPLAEPYAIGCTAEIAQVQSLEEEQMLVVAVGQDRFRILSLKHDRPYLVGVVELVLFEDEPSGRLTTAADRLYPLVIDYLSILADVGAVEFDATQVPTSPEALIYLAAAVIQVPLEQKQAFLETSRATTLLNALRSAYHEEVALLRTLPKESQGPFSVN